MELRDSIKRLPCKLHKYAGRSACVLFGVTDMGADFFDAKWEQGVWTNLPSESHAAEMVRRWNAHLSLLAEVELFAEIARIESPATGCGGWDWKGIHERLTALVARVREESHE